MIHIGRLHVFLPNGSNKQRGVLRDCCSHQLDDQKARSHYVSAFCEQGCAPFAVYWNQSCPEHSSFFSWSCWFLGLPPWCQHHAQIASAGHFWASTVHDVFQHVLLDLHSVPAQLNCIALLYALLYVCVWNQKYDLKSLCEARDTACCVSRLDTPFEGFTSGCSPS